MSTKLIEIAVPANTENFTVMLPPQARVRHVDADESAARMYVEVIDTPTLTKRDFILVPLNKLKPFISGKRQNFRGTFTLKGQRFFIYEVVDF